MRNYDQEAQQNTTLNPNEFEECIDSGNAAETDEGF